jgi:general secretion pathway protein G
MNTDRIKRMKQHSNRKYATAGFSLIELMVVIAIIAMLATVVGVQMFDALDEGNVTKAKAEIKNFETALVGYKIAFKKMPSMDEGLNALVNNSKKKFLNTDTIPKDPWGNEYVYNHEGGNNYTIISYGEDGKSGGTGVNADINSNNLSGDED